MFRVSREIWNSPWGHTPDCFRNLLERGESWGLIGINQGPAGASREAGFIGELGFESVGGFPVWQAIGHARPGQRPRHSNIRTLDLFQDGLEPPAPGDHGPIPYVGLSARCPCLNQLFLMNCYFG